uniref:Acyl-CoA-binding protein n=1 Tax=Equus asinus TaxID=9793 RepID=A0A8C4LUF8_EQUAS
FYIQALPSTAETIHPLKHSSSDTLECMKICISHINAKQQVTVSDINTKRSGMLDLKGKAWNKLKGPSKDDAMKAYIDKVEDLKKNMEYKGLDLTASHAFHLN